LLSLLVEKDARSRIPEFRDVRQAGIGDGAAKGDDMRGPARAVGVHHSVVTGRTTSSTFIMTTVILRRESTITSHSGDSISRPPNAWISAPFVVSAAHRGR
jgi:hypothetical protein